MCIYATWSKSRGEGSTTRVACRVSGGEKVLRPAGHACALQLSQMHILEYDMILYNVICRIILCYNVYCYVILYYSA